MDILSADSTVPEARFLIKMIETQKSASFRELMEKNPSRRISDEDLEECLELLSKPSVLTFVGEATNVSR